MTDMVLLPAQLRTDAIAGRPVAIYYSWLCASDAEALAIAAKCSYHDAGRALARVAITSGPMAIDRAIIDAEELAVSETEDGQPSGIAWGRDAARALWYAGDGVSFVSISPVTPQGVDAVAVVEVGEWCDQWDDHTEEHGDRAMMRTQIRVAEPEMKRRPRY